MSTNPRFLCILDFPRAQVQYIPESRRMLIENFVKMRRGNDEKSVLLLVFSVSDIFSLHNPEL